MPNVDSESLRSLLARLTVYPEERAAAANEYMPAILDLVATDPDGVDAVPEGLVPILLDGCELQTVLQFIPPQMFDMGLQMAQLQSGLLDQLAKVTKQDLASEAVRMLASTAVGLLGDPQLQAVGKVEKIAARLNQFGVLQEYVPFAKLFAGPAELQSRLMALNVMLARSGHLEPKYAVWPLKSPDVLESLVRCDYYANLVAASAHTVGLLDPLLHDAAKLFKSQVEPLLTSSLEQLFVNLAYADANVFADFDKRYRLVDSDAVRLLARLPPLYVKHHHSELVAELQLSSRTLPAFCNLAADESTFDLLHFTPKQLTQLPLDLRLPFMIAATSSRKTAQRFVGRYHSTLQGVLEPAAGPETRDMQARLEFNLRKAGISLGAVRVSSATQ